MTKFPEDNGLWFYEASEHDDVGWLIRKAPNGQVIAEVDPAPDAEDCARLLASAPALLKALKRCLEGHAEARAAIGLVEAKGEQRCTR